ncbi:MAG: zinc ribbon domain-containing protein [Ruminococcaceae bacterium]|nr:zinc ribbon domain-containing protein [Oscillospiraceae bacterium]
MRCYNCNRDYDDNASFCPYCGAPNYNKAQQNNPQQVSPAPQQKKPKEPKKTQRVLTKIILILTATFIILTTALVLLIHFDIIDSPFTEHHTKSSSSQSEQSEETDKGENAKDDEKAETTTYVDTHKAEDFQVDPKNADDFFGDNADIKSKIKADESKTIQTGAEAYKDLTGRGFKQSDITALYTADGKTSGSAVSASDSKKYPMYQTYYRSANNDIWLIISVNGRVMAYPMSYNFEENDEGVAIYVSEKDTMTSFDNVTATFYETVPNDNVVKLIKIKKITSKALDETDIGALIYEQE